MVRNFAFLNVKRLGVAMAGREPRHGTRQLEQFVGLARDAGMNGRDDAAADSGLGGFRIARR
jgi:hypothetical protein